MKKPLFLIAMLFLVVLVYSQKKDFTSSTGIEMVFVEGGTFQMGDDKGWQDEKPVHKVTLESFYIGKYEIKQSEWTFIMGLNPSHFKGRNLPVQNVCWYVTLEFCNQLSIKEGLTPVYSIDSNYNPSNWAKGDINVNWDADGYRLPTEAEWEYAATGGNKSRGYSYSGSNNITLVAVFGRENGGPETVGYKNRPNELRIHDMSGNVWEWCWDIYGNYDIESKTNPRGPSKGQFSVLRGGS